MSHKQSVHQAALALTAAKTRVLEKPRQQFITQEVASLHANMRQDKELVTELDSLLQQEAPNLSPEERRQYVNTMIGKTAEIDLILEQAKDKSHAKTESVELQPEPNLALEEALEEVLDLAEENSYQLTPKPGSNALTEEEENTVTADYMARLNVLPLKESGFENQGPAERLEAEGISLETTLSEIPRPFATPSPRPH